MSQQRSASMAWQHIVRAAQGVRWWITNVMGDRSYDTYVAHQRRNHPEAEVLCENDFWRQKYKHQDESPEGRCC